MMLAVENSTWKKKVDFIPWYVNTALFLTCHRRLTVCMPQSLTNAATVLLTQHFGHDIALFPYAPER